MGMRQELDLARMRAGFAAPVYDAQACFRSVLEALARPGQIQRLAALPTPPAGLGAAQSALLLALADHDTPVWLASALRSGEAGDYLRFHCGCPLITNTADAQFVMLSGPSALAELPALDDLRVGEPNFPDRSATLIVEVAELAAGGPLHLRGPGIADQIGLFVAGWTDAATTLVQTNRRRFPLGVDLVLTCGDRVAGLPRTVHLSLEGMACT
jgi:alpha-D-ribose 1-methylphosphonate 5-triphosphate synthase subunit PhnH